MILNFINRLVSIFKYIIEDKNNKLENMYKKLNNKYNNIISIFNDVVNRITWFITVRKWRDNFRNKFSK